MHLLLEPGFFSSPPVHTAALVGTVTALVSAVVGVFTVIRSQSFAGHALTDVATAGGSVRLLAGVAPLAGFVGGGVVGAGAMEAVGVQRVAEPRPRHRSRAWCRHRSVGPVLVPRHDLECDDRCHPTDPLRLDLHHRAIDHSGVMALSALTWSWWPCSSARCS